MGKHPTFSIVMVRPAIVACARQEAWFHQRLALGRTEPTVTFRSSNGFRSSSFYSANLRRVPWGEPPQAWRDKTLSLGRGVDWSVLQLGRGVDWSVLQQQQKSFVSTLTTDTSSHDAIPSSPTNSPQGSDKRPSENHPFHEPTKSSSNHETNDDDDMSLFKLELLRAALQQVPTYGWTKDALVAAVPTLGKSGVSPSVAGLVTPVELVSFVMDDWNHRLAQELDLEYHNNRRDDPANSFATTTTPTTTTVDRIANALQRRLEYQQELVSCRQWHHAMALGVSTPQTALQTSQQLQTLIHTVLSKTSPSSLSVSSLSHVTLGGVYVATELHMLADSSPNYQDTWNFLRHRVQEWYQSGTVGSSSSSSSPVSMISVAGVTVSAVASAVASGLASVFHVPGGSTTNLPRTANQAVTWAMVAASRLSSTPTTTNRPDGSSPSHYHAPPSPSPTAAPNPITTASTSAPPPSA